MSESISNKSVIIFGCVVAFIIIISIILFFIFGGSANGGSANGGSANDIYNELKLSRVFVWIDKTNPVYLDESHPFKSLTTKQHLYQGNDGESGEWRIKKITLPDGSVVYRFIFNGFFVSFNPAGDGYYDRQSYSTYQTKDGKNVSKCDVAQPIKYVDFTFYKKYPDDATLYIFRNVTDPTRYITVQNNIKATAFTSEATC